MIRPFLLLAFAAGWSAAAVTIDLDLVRLRQAPDAAAVQARLDAALPASASLKLRALETVTGFDPRRDLRRVVIDVPDAGAPSVRLIGLPAERIAALLARRAEGVRVAGGRLAYPLPRRPQALFVALGADEAVIGAAAALAAIAPRPADSGAAIVLALVPGPQPRAPWLALTRSVRLTSDGAGSLTVAVDATDEAAAIELERRAHVIAAMVDTGAEGDLPAMQDAQQLLAQASGSRQGDRLRFAATVPAELRQRAIDRWLGRVERRLAGGGGWGDASAAGSAD